MLASKDINYCLLYLFMSPFMQREGGKRIRPKQSIEYINMDNNKDNQYGQSN